MSIANAKTTKIDAEGLRAWIEEQGMGLEKFSFSIGRSKSYISQVIRRGEMMKCVYDHMLQVYGLPQGMFVPVTPAAPTTPEIPEENPTGYTIGLQVKPDRLRISLNFNGEELHYSWAKIFGDSELELIKSISYAAHMMYKYAEQDDMAKGDAE